MQAIEMAKNPGLPLDRLENFIGDAKNQPIWRPLADKCDNYYDCKQTDEKILAELRRRGQPDFDHNLIAPAIDGVLGLEAKTRTDWAVLADDDAGLEVVDALNQELNEAARIAQANRACSDAYAAQSKSGLGWVEVNRVSDPFAYKWRVNFVHRDEIWWDWDSTRPDLDDARWLFRKRWADTDTLKFAFPGYADLIDKVSKNWGDANVFNESETEGMPEWLSSAIATEMGTTISRDEWLDSERERALVYEVYYRVWDRKPVIRTPNGEAVLFDPKNPIHAAAVRSKRAIVEIASFKKMRMAYFIGPHRVIDIPSPHPHNKFPYVPFWGFRESKTRIPYGLIRRMIPAQDEINVRRRKLTWLLNKLTVIKEDDAVNMSDDELIDELLYGDSVVNLNKERQNRNEGIDIQWGNEVAGQQFQVMQESMNLIQETAGIYNAFLGQDSNATSGVAIDSLVEQGTTTQGELNDNYRYGRQLVGELLLANIVADIGSREHVTKLNVNKPNEKTKIIILNGRAVDENGKETITNAVTRTKTQVVLSEITNTPGYRQAIARQMMEVIGQVPNPEIQVALFDTIIEMLDIPEDKRNELLKRIRKFNGNIDPESLSEEEKAAIDRKAQLQQEIEDMQLDKLQLELESMTASVEAQRAKTSRDLAEADKVPVEARKTQAETKETLARVKQIVAQTIETRRRIEEMMTIEADQQVNALLGNKAA